MSFGGQRTSICLALMTISVPVAANAASAAEDLAPLVRPETAAATPEWLIEYYAFPEASSDMSATILGAMLAPPRRTTSATESWDVPFHPGAPDAAPPAGAKGLANCGFVETTWSDPKWVLATSDHILRAKVCKNPESCSSGVCTDCWYDQVKKAPCYGDTRFFKFEPGKKGAAAFPMAALGTGTFDGLFIRDGISYQLYTSDCANPVGKKGEGPRFVSLQHWKDHPSGCGIFEPGTILLAGGAGALSNYSIVLGKAEVKQLEFYRSESVAWKDKDALAEEGLYLAGNPVKIKVTLSQPIEDVTEFGCACGLEVRVKSNAEEDPDSWVAVPINGDDVLSGNGKEVRVTITPAELAQLGIQASGADAIAEASSADISDTKFLSYVDVFDFGLFPSNMFDSEAFDAWALGSGKVQRAVGRGAKTKDLEKVPPRVATTADFVRSAGTRLIDARYQKVHAQPRQIQNAADWFYISAHGDSKTGKILLSGELVGDKSVLASTVRWGDVDTVFIAGCAILDIKDYNGNYGGAGTSPGLQWIATGPQRLLGYNFVAPLDNNVGDKKFTAKIISKCLASSVPLLDAWAQANADMAETTNHEKPGGRPYNACGIDLTPATGFEIYGFFQVQTSPMDLPIWTTKLSSEWAN